MAGKPQAEKAVERFPELGCFAVAVRRIVYEKGMTLDNAIKKSGISKSAWFAGMAGSGGKPTRRNHARGANCRDAEGSRSA